MRLRLRKLLVDLIDERELRLRPFRLRARLAALAPAENLHRPLSGDKDERVSRLVREFAGLRVISRGMDAR